MYDNVMNVIFFDSLPKDEKNPFASWIIESHGVEGLVQIKAVTTILAVGIMLYLIKTRYKLVAYPVLVFQLGLFYYLTCHVPVKSGYFGKDFALPLKLFFEFYLGSQSTW